MTQAEIEEYLRAVSEGVSRARRAEVEAGTWRNPALSPDAREKLSRPRVHGDDRALHSAIEKLRQGLAVAELTPAEREAHRANRRSLYARRGDEARAWRRGWYRKQMATEPGRASLGRNGSGSDGSIRRQGALDAV